MPQNRTLSAKQRKAIEGLVTAGTVAGAAQHAGCSRDTLYRWLRDDLDFAHALGEAEAETVAVIARRLAAVGPAAVEALHASMTDDAAPPAARIRAASAILGHVLRVRELAVVETRLHQLEATEPEAPAR
jgi:transposase-like protein